MSVVSLFGICVIRLFSPMIEVSTAQVVQKAIYVELALSFTFFVATMQLLSKKDEKEFTCCRGLAVGSPEVS